jgi:pimeloyl-ACP methyl ester carboxylesterase
VNGQPLRDPAGENGQPAGLPEPQIFILKFNGAGGRAERTSIHPLDFWSDVPGEIWSPNPPGYGASEGKPSLKWLAPTGRAVLDELLQVAGDRPIVLTGNSLGTTVALHLAARYAGVANLAAMLLRNPPPLSELIRGKFGWRTLGLSLGVARQIPRDLDSTGNARRAKVPCVLLCSGRDRIVPPRFQQLIIEAYGGPKQVVTIPAADHVFELSEPDLTAYAAALSWLRAASSVKFGDVSNSLAAGIRAH